MKVGTSTLAFAISAILIGAAPLSRARKRPLRLRQPPQGRPGRSKPPR